MNTLFREQRLGRIIADLSALIYSNLQPVALEAAPGFYASPSEADGAVFAPFGDQNGIRFCSSGNLRHRHWSSGAAVRIPSGIQRQQSRSGIQQTGKIGMLGSTHNGRNFSAAWNCYDSNSYDRNSFMVKISRRFRICSRIS